MSYHQQHYLSAAFPAMLTEDFDALCADIEQNGQRDPVVLFEGEVIDGWHRTQACALVGVEVQVVDLPAGTDPVAFVKSRNLHRRHLSASQRAMAVASCAEWLPVGKPSNSAATALFATSSGNSAAAALLPADAPVAGKSLAALADDAGVSRRTMAQAAKVVKQAAPEVARAVKDGGLTVERAAEIAALPKADQPAAVAAPKPAQAKKAAPADDELQARLTEQAERIEDLTRTAQELLDENKAMAVVFDADDRLAASMAENKRLTSLLRTASERVNGLMFEKQEMTAEVKKMQRLVERLQKPVPA